MLLRSCEIALSLNLPHIVLVMNQAICAKAQQIRWGDPVLRQKLVVRLSEFHTTMPFLAVIGKRSRDAGLEDILIESGVVAQGSINGVLSGE